MQLLNKRPGSNRFSSSRIKFREEFFYFFFFFFLITERFIIRFACSEDFDDLVFEKKKKENVKRRKGRYNGGQISRWLFRAKE